MISNSIIILVFVFIVEALCSTTRWTEKNIVEYMAQHPNRAYFPDLFSKGGYRVGIEVGVASGRFSELFLMQLRDIGPWEWYMVDPNINRDLNSRFQVVANDGKGVLHSDADAELSWEKRRIGINAKKTFIQDYSTTRACQQRLQNIQFDFIYLDGAHDYSNVKRELSLFWHMLKPGGMMAGHDYCNYGEAALDCLGCDIIPKCRPYTEYGQAAGKESHHLQKLSANQEGVVRAVQEWMFYQQPKLRLYHTVENFTRDSLAADGLDYDIVITHTYNPSWFVIKPSV
jgi:hypothetical protein